MWNGKTKKELSRTSAPRPGRIVFISGMMNSAFFEGIFRANVCLLCQAQMYLVYTGASPHLSHKKKERFYPNQNLELELNLI